MRDGREENMKMNVSLRNQAAKENNITIYVCMNNIYLPMIEKRKLNK